MAPASVTSAAPVRPREQASASLPAGPAQTLSPSTKNISWVRMVLVVLGSTLGGLVLVESWRVVLGPNFAIVVPGRLYRSAQLKPGQLRSAVRRFGIKTVINLRGCCPQESWHRQEAEVLRELGVELVDINLSSAMPPPVPELRRLIAALAIAERPVLLHCRRGADRTSLAAAFAVLMEPAGTLEKARWQLSWRYGHSPVGEVQILDESFEQYSAWLAAAGTEHSPDRLQLWVSEHYQPRHCWARIVPLEVPERLQLGKWSVFRFRVENRSRYPWYFKQAAHTGIHLRLFVREPGTEQFLTTSGAGFFDEVVWPGGSLELIVPVAPLNRVGPVDVFVDLSDEQMCWFHMVGSPPWTKRLEVGP